MDPVPEILIGSTQHFLDTSSSRHADGRPEPIPFERVRAIKVLSDGRIVVADAGPVEVMVFDSLGGLASRFVGRGGGPGELTSIGDVHVCERDSIVVVSQFDTVFDSAGAWLGGLTLPNRFDLRAVARGRVYGVARDSLDVETVLGRRHWYS